MRNLAAQFVVPLRGSHFGDPSRLEPVKWLAVVAMICDHLALTLLPSEQWLRQVGTFAFPAFALSFGIGLAASSDPLRVVKRLIWPAAVAQVCWIGIDGGWHPLNVLVVFAVCAAFVGLLLFRAGAQVVAADAALCIAVCGVAAVSRFLGFEGGLMGFLLVGGAYLGARHSAWWALPPVLVWVALLPSVGFVLGVLAVLFAPRLSWALPRRPGALAWVYAGHLWVIVTALLFVVAPQ